MLILFIVTWYRQWRKACCYVDKQILFLGSNHSIKKKNKSQISSGGGVRLCNEEAGHSLGHSAEASGQGDSHEGFTYGVSNILKRSGQSGWCSLIWPCSNIFGCVGRVFTGINKKPLEPPPYSPISPLEEKRDKVNCQKVGTNGAVSGQYPFPYKGTAKCESVECRGKDAISQSSRLLVHFAGMAAASLHTH